MDQNNQNNQNKSEDVIIMTPKVEGAGGQIEIPKPKADEKSSLNPKIIAIIAGAAVLVIIIIVALVLALKGDSSDPGSSEGGGSSSGSNTPSALTEKEKQDKHYRTNASQLSESIKSYQTNHAGELPAIENNRLVGFDSYLQLGETFYDPATGKQYKIKAYESFVDSPYASDDSELFTIASDYFFIFYKANCVMGAVVESYNPRDFVIVHSKADYSNYSCL